MAETLPYIPPRSPGDPPSPELLILFFEGIASAVPESLRELRDEFLPSYNPPYTPPDWLFEWWKRWHLDSSDVMLCEMIQNTTFNVLDYWRRDPSAAEQLKVDCGWWHRNEDRRIVMAGDLPPQDLKIHRWNPDRESFEAFASRVRGGIERFLVEEKQREEARLEKYDAKPYGTRERKFPPRLRFEWLALSVCRRLSDAQIAIKYRVSRDAVKKARQRLSRELGIHPGT